MAKTSGDFEKEFIETAKQHTGRTVEEWMPVLAGSGYTKPMELLNWLKEAHGMNHLQANLLSGMYLNGGKPVYMNEGNLLDQQFAKAENMRILFDGIVAKIQADFADVQVIPKKTYVSFTATREFAAINIKPKELRLGLDLGDEPCAGRVAKSKLTGPMPRISHMVVLTAVSEYDAELVALLRQSYGRCHKK
jgi:hypothetical protein